MIVVTGRGACDFDAGRVTGQETIGVGFVMRERETCSNLLFCASENESKLVHRDIFSRFLLKLL